MSAETRQKTGQRRETTSLSKALAILRLVATKNASGIKLADAGRWAGLGTTTTHRLMHALTDEGFLSYDPYTRRYFLGTDAAALGAASGWGALAQDLRQPLQSVLEKVAARTGDTSYLSIRQDMSAVCVGKAPGSFAVSANTLDLGARRPLGAGAGSLALLAAETPERAERIVTANAEIYERYGRLTADSVRAALAAARREGHAFNDSQIIEGVGAVGVPVYDPQRAPGEALVAAISVAAISSRLRIERRQEICAAIREILAEFNLSDRRDDLATDTLL
jgi:DNA-binding IclR family transcriptional regulator